MILLDQDRFRFFTITIDNIFVSILNCLNVFDIRILWVYINTSPASPARRRVYLNASPALEKCLYNVYTSPAPEKYLYTPHFLKFILYIISEVRTACKKKCSEPRPEIGHCIGMLRVLKKAPWNY